MTPVGLYVHIPFCRARCGYCDFATVAGMDDKIDSYLTCLKKELIFHQGKVVDTVFLGGGTPSLLSPEQIKDLFSHIHHAFEISSSAEITIEANPESLTEEKIQAFVAGGVNRISFGLQATQNTLLQKIDRLHTWEDFLQKWSLARMGGIKNLNADLIFGLPSQSMEQWVESLNSVMELKPEHISLYALKVEPGTPFHRDGVEINNDLQAEMYLEASTRLRAAQFHHYEISNFCQPGFQSRHNLKYWHNKPTLGVGVSAASFSNGTRTTNTRSLQNYMEALQETDSPPHETQTLDVVDQKREQMMLELRLNSGTHWPDLRDLDIPHINQFLNAGLAHIAGSRYVLNPKGWLVSNQLFQSFV